MIKIQWVCFGWWKEIAILSGKLTYSGHSCAKKYFLICNHTLFVILRYLPFLPMKMAVEPGDGQIVVSIVLQTLKKLGFL